VCGITLPTDFHLRTIGCVACPRTMSALFHGQPELETVQSGEFSFHKNNSIVICIEDGGMGKMIKMEIKSVFLYQVNSNNNINVCKTM